MNRSTCVYVLMVFTLAGGIWMILRYGSAALTARHDLAGEWTLLALPGTASEGTTLTVEQSGRYFNVTFAGAAPMRLKMVEETLEPGRKQIRLSGDDGQIVFAQSAPLERWRITAVGKVRGDWNAELTTPAYPRARASTRAT